MDWMCPPPSVHVLETYLPILHIYSNWGWDLWEVVGIGWVEKGRPDDIGSFIRCWGEEAGLLDVLPHALCRTMADNKETPSRSQADTGVVFLNFSV